MKIFSFSLSLTTQTHLQTIEILRRDIFATPLSPKVEAKLRFETMVEKIYGILALSHQPVKKSDIIKGLTTAVAKKPDDQRMLALKNALSFISYEWTMNPKPITYGTVAAVTKEFGHTIGESTALTNELSRHKIEITELVTFLDSTKDHPIVSSLIALLQTMAIAPLGEKSAQLSFCLMFLYIHKYGYDIRGILSVIPSWLSEPALFSKTMLSSQTTGNYTPFLEFAIQQLVEDLTTLKKNLTDELSHTIIPSSLFSLSDRQKEILSLLDDPKSSITNRAVQKRFHVSQITASRELTKLSALGILYPHGKGRSVNYTKV